MRAGATKALLPASALPAGTALQQKELAHQEAMVANKRLEEEWQKALTASRQLTDNCATKDAQLESLRTSHNNLGEEGF